MKVNWLGHAKSGERTVLRVICKIDSRAQVIRTAASYCVKCLDAIVGTGIRVSPGGRAGRNLTQQIRHNQMERSNVGIIRKLIGIHLHSSGYVLQILFAARKLRLAATTDEVGNQNRR